jgi:uncharacterized protein YlxW (UPF0749 family)
MKHFPLRARENPPVAAGIGRGAWMNQRRMVILAAAFFLAAPVAGAQQKIKDEGLHQYLVQEFARIDERLDKLTERVAAAENRLLQLEKLQAALGVGQAQTETLLKSSDTSLSSLRLSTQQDLFELKAGIVELKTQLSQTEKNVHMALDEMKKAMVPTFVAQASPSSTSPPAQPGPVGYIDNSDSANWVINIGTADAVRVGEQFHVFHVDSTDGHETEAGAIEVTEVVEAHKSRIKVVSSKPDIKIDFGDIVRNQ